MQRARGGHLGQNVAILAGVEEPEVCLVAGLLHDIGKPVVATMLLEAEAQIAQRNPKLWSIDGDAWVGVVERTHRKIATDVAKKWQLPEEVQNAVLQFSDYDAANRQSIANAVHFANALAKQMGIALRRGIRRRQRCAGHGGTIVARARRRGRGARGRGCQDALPVDVVMGTLGGFASPSAPANTPCHPRATLGLAKPCDASLPAKLAGSARVYLARTNVDLGRLAR